MDYSNRLSFSVAALLAGALALAQNGAVPTDPTKTNPLKPGASVPTVNVTTVEGKSVLLKDALGGKPTVLVFYRGSWCPYCSAHLAELGKIEKDLIAAGYQIVAVSPDKPEGLKQATEKNKLTYTLLSDSKADAAKAFGVAFVVDPAMIERYKGFGIDLQAASGERHSILPVPAVFLVDKSGKITYAYSNPDYRVRIKGADLLEAARAQS